MKKFKNWYFPDSEEHLIDYLKHLNTDEYQKKQRKASLGLLDNKRIGIDIGANVGLWAKDLCEIFNEENYLNLTN